MTDEIKIKFEVDYDKSSFEEGLEEIVGSTFSKPKFHQDDETYGVITRTSKIDKYLKVEYKRDLNLWDFINAGYYGASEYITLDYFGDEIMSLSSKLDINNKELPTCSIDDDLWELAPNYDGLLKKMDENEEVKIAKDQFLSELSKILRDYKNTK